MKRNELQSLVQKFIPSFNEKDFTKDELFSDYNYGYEIPYTIPKEYGVGYEIEKDGLKYMSQHRYEGGRRVNLDISTFLNGNGHFYGDLVIKGPQFMCDGHTIWSGELIKAYPSTADIKGPIRRVLPESDYKSYPDHWEEDDVGFLTIRFYSLKELICSAAWVALDRIEGEFSFAVGCPGKSHVVEFFVTKTGTIKFPKDSRIKNMIKK